LPRGWVKQRRKEIETLLNNPRVRVEEKEKAVDYWVRQYTGLKFNDAERIESSALAWDLCWHPKLSTKLRDTLYRGYKILLNDDFHFPKNSPRAYREAMRLRSIFSDPKFDLAKRVRAADAYGALVSALDLATQVGFGEAHMGRQALAQLLRAKGVKRGTRNYFEINVVLVEIEARFQDFERRAKGQMEH